MDLQYFGANCIKITSRKAVVVIDDNLGVLGLKRISKAGDVLAYSTKHEPVTIEAKLVIDMPGEYEVSDVSVRGIPARSHMDEEGKKTATIFKFMVEDIDVVSLGHIYPELTDDQLEAIGTVDVLLIPVGGNGYTLDPIGALKLIKKIEPKLVIPTHYADSAISYPVPQQELENALKELAMEPRESVDKLKLKSTDFISDLTQLVVLNRQ